MPRFASIRPLVAALTITSLTFAAWALLHRQQAQSVVPAHAFRLQADHSGEWTPFGGSWEVADGSVKTKSYERGAKLVAGSPSWGNYTLNSDIWFDGPAADMGVAIRTNDEAQGVDAYNGYFVGLRSLDGTLVLGRADYSWTEVRPVEMPGGIGPFKWYRLRVTAYGCNIAATVTNLTTQQTASIAYQERFCVTSGRFALRSLNANARWSNVNVEPASRQDYDDMARHAAVVQRPIKMSGPPWWTPWHVGVLFTGALAFALLVQLAYFRFTSWKIQTITREREWLAHEIHDTMAQGFAGVGYQIQGIRSSIVRGERFDPRTIADQLHVAYQLVHSCHEEASKTIAILGSASPAIQKNLLGELAETARKAVGDKIKATAELRGNPAPLNLRLADALLHIGQEAIANALSHGDPTILKITLSYEDSSVELAVEDNGCGFEYSQDSAGFGILGMQKRARSVRGALQILSKPGQGTQIRVTARLQRRSSHNPFLSLRKRGFRSVPTAGD